MDTGWRLFALFQGEGMFTETVGEEAAGTALDRRDLSGPSAERPGSGASGKHNVQSFAQTVQTPSASGPQLGDISYSIRPTLP
ncbi:unnamed protein product [Gadus morhua 'NCC']